MRKHLIAVLTASACGALLAPGVAGVRRRQWRETHLTATR